MKRISLPELSCPVVQAALPQTIFFRYYVYIALDRSAQLYQHVVEEALSHYHGYLISSHLEAKINVPR